MTRAARLLITTAVLCGTACKEDAPTAPDSSSATPQPAVAPGTATAAASGASPTASARLGPEIATGPFPDTETKPPTVKEWNTAARPMPARYAASLWCETRELREWVRVSCRAPPSANNQPTAIEVVSAPRRGQHYTLTRAGVASVVLQPRRGQSSEFEIEWSTWGKRKLRIDFPDGAERPTLVFDQPGPTGKDGAPRCEDICGPLQGFFSPTGDCSPIACGEGFKCYPGSEESAAMCMCDKECSW